MLGGPNTSCFQTQHVCDRACRPPFLRSFAAPCPYLVEKKRKSRYTAVMPDHWADYFFFGGVKVST